MQPLTIAVTGASGFIGDHLTPRLKAAGHAVRPISLRREIDSSALENCDAVIHLAGEPVAQRWTASARKRIMDSRVVGTRRVVGALERLQKRPEVLMSASAVGYYGSHGDEVLTETSSPVNDFLSEVTTAWETEARQAARLDVRVVSLRIGVVLGKNGGALKTMLPPFKLGIGGRLGTGKQWMSWIHVEDLCSLILFALDHREVQGPINAVSPKPVTNSTFTRALAGALHRPAILPVPAIALKMLFGEMSQMLLEGQRVMPEAALRAGFTFRFPEISAALRDVLG